MSGGSWHADALCANRPDLDPVFFPERGGSSRGREEEAKEFCNGCPVKAACLDAALTEETGMPWRDRHGVRGGLAPKERARMDTSAGSGLRRAIKARPSNCTNCHRAMRGGGTEADGRVEHAAHGLCTTCYSGAYKRKAAVA